MRFIYLAFCYLAEHPDYRIGWATVLAVYLAGLWVMILLPAPLWWAGPCLHAFAGWLLGGRLFRTNLH